MDQFNFDTYPNTDFNKVNLDWMLEQFPELEARIRALETGGGGASGDSVFHAVYGTTSFTEIQTALNNNLLPYLEESGDYYTLLMVRPFNISFFRMSGALVWVAICNDTTGWSKYSAEYVTTQSPHFSGIPTAPTAPDGTNSAQLATTAFVKQAIDAIPQGGGEGLSEEAKLALLECFEHVAWVDANGQSYYNALHDALFPPAELLSISALFSQGAIRIYPDSSLDELRPMLTVTAHYDDDTSSEVTTYSLSGTLTVGTSTVVVSYLSKTTSILVTVSEPSTLVSISAVYTQPGAVYDTDSLDSLKADLVVTATYSDSSTAVVPSADYTLSGTLTEGTSTITVSYEGKTDTFTVTVQHQSTTTRVSFSDIAGTTGTLIKLAKTTAAIGAGSYYVLPYHDGMTVVSITNPAWIANYPAQMVDEGGTRYVNANAAQGDRINSDTYYFSQTYSGYTNATNVVVNIKTAFADQCYYEYEG